MIFFFPTETIQKKGIFSTKSHKKRSSSDDVVVLYNQEILKLFEKLWDPQPSKRFSSSKITMFIMATLHSPIFTDIIANIKVIEEFKITKEDAIEKTIRGYGCLDYMIKPVREEGYHIVINVQPSTPEKEGLGVTITQMLSVREICPNATHVLGICSDGERWIFIDMKGQDYFEYIEKRDHHDILLTLRMWLYKVGTLA